MNSDLERCVEKRYNTWYRSGMLWQVLHYFLGMLAIVATALVGLKTFENRLTLLTVTTTVCVAVVSFINPAKLGAGYINAWRLLDAEFRRYKAGEEREKLESLNIAIDRGERMIATNEPITSQRANGTGT